MQPSWLLTSSQKKVYKLTFIFIYSLVFGLGFGLIVSLYISWVIGLIAGFAAAKNAEIKPTERLHWSWKKLDKGLIISLDYGIIIGLIAALTALLITLLILKAFLGIKYSLIYTLCGGLIGGLVSGIIYMLIASDVKRPEIPNQGIVQSAKNSILTGIFGTVFILILGITFIIWLVLFLRNKERIAIFFKFFMSDYLGIPLLGMLIIIALGVGIIAALMVGGKACIQHFVLRLILYRNGYIPWNYARFLDYCTECLFLQRVGGRYRFIHRLLQEHFAAMPLKQ